MKTLDDAHLIALLASVAYCEAVVYGIIREYERRGGELPLGCTPGSRRWKF